MSSELQKLANTMNTLRAEWLPAESAAAITREAHRVSTEFAYNTLRAYSDAQHALLVALTTPTGPSSDAAAPAPVAPAAPAPVAPAAVPEPARSASPGLDDVPVAPPFTRVNNV